MIISLIWGLVIILGVNQTFDDALSIEDRVIKNVKQAEIVNGYNAEVVRCDNVYSYNSPSWTECIKNASIDFEIGLLDEEHYQKLRTQMRSIIED